jgi:DNA-binding MarR family transcriptional regulator
MTTRKPLKFDPVAEARAHWVASGWEDAAPGMALVTSVMRVQQVFLAQVDEVLAPHGLTFARYELLMLLTFTRKGELPLGKISERLQVHAASVTNAVDRLEAQGLVRRDPHPSDGRAVLAVLTPAGRKVAKQATVDVNAKVFTSLGVSSEEADEIFTLLRGLRRSAGDF